MISTGRIVIVTGPPGAGKTAVARALADAEDRSAHVESDWFYRFVRSGFVPPYEPASAEQNRVVMDIVCDAVLGYARAGCAVYWDGVVGPWFLDQIAGRLGDGGFGYVVLRPSREVALARVQVRDGDATSSGAAQMYEAFADLGQYESHVVSSDGPLADVVAAVQARLS